MQRRSPAKQGDARKAYRLRGQLDGTAVLGLLRPGQNGLGASRDNNVVIAAAGVSRHHAAIELSNEGALLVRDLGSKNGTWVNGLRVREGGLAPGDWVQLGPVALLVEEVDPDDAVVAIPGVVSGSPEPDDRPAGETEGWDQRPLGQETAALSLLHDLVPGLLAGDGPGLGEALASLAAGIDATGIALMQARTGESPIAVAAWGEPAALRPPRSSEIPPARGDSENAQSGVGAGEPPSLWAGIERNGTTHTLQVVGERLRDCAASRLLLETALLIVSRDRAVPAPRRRPLAPRAALSFPEAHVPGRSPAMRALHDQLQLLLHVDIPVLIVGETGVGKEHVASILHHSSPRRAGPFVAVNCAAIPSELLEAELFGIERGVATGVGAREGKFRLASGGTILLDEIGDMPLPLQAKLLRALQAREVVPLGARRPVRVDVRVLTATNSDLAARMDRGEFRRDLYYRIAAVTVRVPPLRERRADIPVLVAAFLGRSSSELRRPVAGITAKALRALVDAPWPGNVRELEHEIRRLVALCPVGAVIDSAMLSESVAAPTVSPAPGAVAVGADLDLARHVQELERHLVAAALARSRGNRTRAAQLLGVSRPGLLMKMRRLGLE